MFNSSLGSQEIPPTPVFYGIPRVPWTVFTTAAIFLHPKPDQSTPCSFKINFNIFPHMCRFSFGSSQEDLISISLFHSCNMPSPFYLPLVNRSNNIWWEIQIKLLIMQFSPASMAVWTTCWKHSHCSRGSWNSKHNRIKQALCGSWNSKHNGQSKPHVALETQNITG